MPKLSKDVFGILFENAKTYSERKKLDITLEGEVMQQSVATQLITKLYTSAVEKAHIDFEDLPKTRGDFSKYKGYKELQDSINLLEDLTKAQGLKVAEIQVVKTAVENITARKDIYERAFVTDNEIGIMSYLTLSYATVAATSALISSYIDFIKKPDKLEFTLVRSKQDVGNILFTSLESFNKACINGT